MSIDIMRTMTKLNQTKESSILDAIVDADKEALKGRRIRSFVLRQGRVTKGPFCDAALTQHKAAYASTL